MELQRAGPGVNSGQLASWLVGRAGQAYTPLLAAASNSMAQQTPVTTLCITDMIFTADSPSMARRRPLAPQGSAASRPPGPGPSWPPLTSHCTPGMRATIGSRRDWEKGGWWVVAAARSHNCRRLLLPASSPASIVTWALPGGGGIEALWDFETFKVSLRLLKILSTSQWLLGTALSPGGGIEALSKFQSQTLKDSFRLSEFLSNSDYLRLSKFPSDLQHFFDTFKFLSLPLSPFTIAWGRINIDKITNKKYAKECKSCLSYVAVSHSGWNVSLFIEIVHVIKIVGVRRACMS